MRNRLIVILSALLLASAHLAQAQTPPTRPLPPDVPGVGLVDFGARVGPIDGDEDVLHGCPPAKFRSRFAIMAPWRASGYPSGPRQARATGS